MSMTSASTLQSPPRACRVLLVDDDVTQLKLTRIRLEDSGFLVETAFSAEEALDMAPQSPPDAIVSDVLMGELDGFGLCRKVREDVRLASVPVILLSAHYGAAEDKALAARVGASGLVTRTPDFDDELAMLRAALANRCSAPARVPDSVVYEQHLRTNANQLTKLLGKAKYAEEEAEARYRSLVERMPEVIWTADDAQRITFITANVEQVAGFTPDEMRAGGLDLWSERIHRDDLEGALAAIGAADRKAFDIEYRWQRKDQKWIWLRCRAIATYERGGMCYLDGMFSDVTEKKQLEESFRQAQKMEAIGQFTGAIAHDFNNILAAILANSHFLLEDLADHDPRHADAESIKVAAERAAALTRQLLAFSRRQVLKPMIVDLNATVTSIEGMLRRLIGEDIEFSVVPGADLGSVRVDVGQLEQVIMNLVVNARDAMPTGGGLSIETTNVELDDDYAASHVPVAPGRYVMLAVTDTGCGMDDETKRRTFEPFFTTKAAGKGTGLGLSTCYGIVKQSGGYIWVYSELGRGTVFKIYLPRVDGRPDQTRRLPGRLDLRGTETILLIEDDERVRNAVARMLEPRGYQLLVARNGTEGIDIACRYQGNIDLILSDVVMPGACGPDVVEQVRKRCGSVRALFMSGYTDHAVLRSGDLQAGMNFIQKPFAPEALAKKIREVLDIEASASSQS